MSEADLLRDIDAEDTGWSRFRSSSLGHVTHHGRLIFTTGSSWQADDIAELLRLPERDRLLAADEFEALAVEMRGARADGFGQRAAARSGIAAVTRAKPPTRRKRWWQR